MVETLIVYNIHLYVEVNSYKVSIQCPNFLMSSISQVTVHIFSWWSWSWHQELTLLGRWFSRCSPWPQETRSGSRAAWTIVSPPCSGVFITNLEHIENYSYFQLQGFPFKINRLRTWSTFVDEFRIEIRFYDIQFKIVFLELTLQQGRISSSTRHWHRDQWRQLPDVDCNTWCPPPPPACPTSWPGTWWTQSEPPWSCRRPALESKSSSDADPSSPPRSLENCSYIQRMKINKNFTIARSIIFSPI